RCQSSTKRGDKWRFTVRKNEGRRCGAGDDLGVSLLDRTVPQDPAHPPGEPCLAALQSDQGTNGRSSDSRAGFYQSAPWPGRGVPEQIVRVPSRRILPVPGPRPMRPCIKNQSFVVVEIKVQQELRDGIILFRPTWLRGGSGRGRRCAR